MVLLCLFDTAKWPELNPTEIQWLYVKKQNMRDIRSNNKDLLKAAIKATWASWAVPQAATVPPCHTACIKRVSNTDNYCICIKAIWNVCIYDLKKKSYFLFILLHFILELIHQDIHLIFGNKMYRINLTPLKKKPTWISNKSATVQHRIFTCLFIHYLSNTYDTNLITKFVISPDFLR